MAILTLAAGVQGSSVVTAALEGGTGPTYPRIAGTAFVGGVWSAAVSVYRSNLANDRLEDLTPWLSGGAVDWDATRAVKGGGSLTLRRGGLLSLADMVRCELVMVREDGETRSGQIGLYVPSMPDADHDVPGSEATYGLRDLTALLKDSVLRSTYNVAGGTQYVTAISTLLGQVGLTRYALPTSSATLPAGKAIRKGDDRLEGVVALLKPLGSNGVTADLTGRIRADRRRLIRATEPFATYDPSTILATIREERDEAKLGNVAVVRADHPGGAPIVVVRVNDDPDSPASTVSLGRELVLPEIRDRDITTVEDAADAAEEALERAGSWERVVRLSVLADPDVAVNRSFDLIFRGLGGDADLSGRYWVRRWGIPLTGDVRMELTGNRVVRYRAAA